jgi:transmembrane sensor
VLLTLVRGDIGRIDSVGSVTLTRNADITAYTAWTTGALAFNGVRLRDAIPELARWYDVDIRLADSTLADRRFTATFHDEPTTQVFRVLEIALGVRVAQHGNVVTLTPRHSTARQTP